MRHLGARDNHTTAHAQSRLWRMRIRNRNWVIFTCHVSTTPPTHPFLCTRAALSCLAAYRFEKPTDYVAAIRPQSRSRKKVPAFAMFFHPSSTFRTTNRHRRILSLHESRRCVSRQPRGEFRQVLSPPPRAQGTDRPRKSAATTQKLRQRAS